jgi:hypothetical protein
MTHIPSSEEDRRRKMYIHRAEQDRHYVSRLPSRYKARVDFFKDKELALADFVFTAIRFGRGVISFKRVFEKQDKDNPARGGSRSV